MSFIAITAVDVTELASKLTEFAKTNSIENMWVSVDKGIAYAIVATVEL